ncbi:acetyil CoA acetyltransferase/thiolase, putative [Eimeria brunetti]|uniref:Acetyil CoA acetyltransferase/thiolase, putative n=1 Tax=Eimeria brunetti TaxID=51314 RepID=U6LDN1_9EIME|nr:acetyil CoA acetyltransferase/thiolase, putative [Eimeria brunetti]
MQVLSSMRRDFLPRRVVVLGGARTPIGSFLGALRAAPASRLAAAAAAGALQRSGVAPAEIQQCVVGQVIVSGEGRGAHRLALQRAGSLAPLEQLQQQQQLPLLLLLLQLHGSTKAPEKGIPPSASVYGVNGSCPTGLRAACLAASSVALGETPLALAVGVESLSNAPYLLLKARQGGYEVGNGALVDSLVFEGLRGSDKQQLPGKRTDTAAAQWGISRGDCDNYVVQSFKRAADAASSGFFRLEGLLPFSTASAGTPNQRANCAACSPQVPQLQQQQRRVPVSRHRRQQQQLQQDWETPGVVQHDEEVHRRSLDRLASAGPVFGPEGLTTSENAFRLGDGAAAVVLATDEEARKRGLKPLVRQVSALLQLSHSCS